MPNKKISQLDQITSVTGTEVVPVVQGGVVKRTTTGAFTGRLKELARAANATAIQDAKEVGRSTLIDGLSAGAVMQQDMKAVSSALHRSPNAVTAMFVYDTSKDSDGGAWTKKCQHTSWYNEPLAGRWLGAQFDETSARVVGATVGAELVTNGSFSTDTSGWTANGNTLTVENGQLKVVGTAWSYQAVTVVVGKTYVLRADFTVSAVNPYFRVGPAIGAADYYNGSATIIGKSILFTATTTTVYISVGGGAAGSVSLIDNISLKEITAINTNSNDYYQNTTDGKFYRLYKNVLSYSNDFISSYWTKPNAGITFTNKSDYTTVSVPNNLAADSYIFYKQTIPISGAATLSLEVRSTTNTGRKVKLTSDSGFSEVTLTADWQKITHIDTASAHQFYFRISEANTAFAFDVRFAQAEYGSVATAYEHKTAAGTNAEVFRGNKAEFPSLVGIVAEAGNVTLYDLTEPSMPMWMRFLSTAANSLTARALMGNNNVNALSASSGLLVIGNLTNSGYQGSVISMPGDTSRYIVSSGSYMFDGGLSERNIRKLSANGGGYTINSTSINSIATATLADAPVDSNSGLRAVTVAVATSGGISLIKNGTTVYNSTQTLSFDRVYLTPKMLIASRTGDSTLYYYPNPANISANFTLLTEATGAVDFNQGNTTALALENRSEFARSSGAKLQLLKHNETTAAKGAAATITPTYNTGYMVGDIKRSYLTSVAPGTVTSTAFAARSLFLDDTTKGIWLDPSDLGTMFTSSAGGTPVTGVEQQVGLILDKSKGLRGPELVADPQLQTSTGWTTGGWQFNNGVAVATAAAQQATYGTSAVGKLYQYEVRTLTSSVQAMMMYIGGVAIQVANAGTYSGVVRATGTGLVTLYSWGGGSTYYTGQVDYISVREVIGNHAFAPSDAARPTLSARYNLLTKTENFSDATWTTSNLTPSYNQLDAFGGTNAVLIKSNGVWAGHAIVQSGVSRGAAGQKNTWSFYAKANESNIIRTYSWFGSQGLLCDFDLSNGTYTLSQGSNAGMVSVGNGWWRCFVTETAPTASGSVEFSLGATNSGVQSVYLCFPSMVPEDQAGLPYQRVNTATDYDSDATKFPKYLKFSGAQSLQTNSIDFGYTDKMFFCAGVRKLMTSGVGIVAETSSNADITNGAFNVAAPVSSEDYYASHRNGGILAVRGIDEPALLSPVSNVFTTVFGLTGVNSTEIGLRINGIPKTTFSRTEGTASSGFYGSHPLFIGSRNNSQHFFNGQLSQLLVAGCAVTTKQIQDAENYIEQKTYGTYPEFLVDASGNQVVDALGNPLYANVTYQY